MSDFTHDAWGLYVAVITLISIVACAVLLFGLSSRGSGDAGTTGHVWDEDLEEGNHPLPRWWMWLFVITIVFGVAYLGIAHAMRIPEAQVVLARLGRRFGMGTPR